MVKYRVEVARSGGWWAIEFPDVDRRIHSQARRLEQVPAAAAEAITMWFADEGGAVVSPDEIEVATELDDDLGRHVLEAKEARRRIDEAAEVAKVATAQAIAVGLERGLTTRDIGSLLGVSHQYVAKVLKQAG